MFETMTLPETPTAIAPDGSEVRALLVLKGGSMAHFSLPPGQTSIPVAHRTVEEIWFFLTGSGEMWLKHPDKEDVVTVRKGVCLTIPLDTHFQFRSTGEVPLSAVSITMPPWPGHEEAFAVAGKWPPTIGENEQS